MSEIYPHSGGDRRAWLKDIIEVLNNPDRDREDALAHAAGIWLGYPRFGEAIECNVTSDDERYLLRLDLNHASYKAALLLMEEAERVGLNSGPLMESHRVCLEIFRPVWSRSTETSLFGVTWFHHPNRTSDIWPECLGDWRYSLPPAAQEAVRAGSEVFMRLNARLAIMPAQLPTPNETETINADRPLVIESAEKDTGPSDIAEGPARVPSKPQVSLMAANDLAIAIGLGHNPGVVKTFLTRYAAEYEGCRQPLSDRRRGQPQHMYFVDIVWPRLIEMLPGWQSPPMKPDR